MSAERLKAFAEKVARSGAYVATMAVAFRALMQLSPKERGLVLCWFCGDCNEYVGPGERCPCEGRA